MLRNDNKKACPFTDEIVSYIYGELRGGSELEFESHLADCVTCTDEFAAVSNSRFSVYEWQKAEFSHLPTPEIVIPYASTSVDTVDEVGFLAAVRAWLAGVSFPIAVAAGVAVCIGVALIAVNSIGRRDTTIATNVTAPTVPLVSEPDKLTPPFVGQPNETAEKKDMARAPEPIKAAGLQPKRAGKRSSPDINRPFNDVAVKTSTQGPPIRRAPVLTSDEDSDDKSLRLADLFDEVGG